VALFDSELARPPAYLEEGPESHASTPTTLRPRWAFVGTGQVVVGLTLLFTGTVFLDSAPMALRVLAAAVGLAFAYRGLHDWVRAATVRKVDMAYGLALVWVVVIAGAALLAPILPLGEHVNTAKTLNVASYARPDLFSAHPLGTNQFGLDMLARVIWGGRESLTASTVAIVVGTTIGAVIGVVAGYFGGRVDQFIGVVNNVGLAFPPLVLLLALAAALRQSVFGLAFALAVLVIPSTIRVARAHALTFGQREFTFAARILGATRRQVLVREILPNVAAPLASIALITIPFLIIAEASLSFLGLGLPPPQPSWGNMVAEGTNGVFEANPHIVLVPGTVLFLTVFSLNLIGQRLRQKWDPRQIKL
jgi:peptide/nickel transport system permease protein